MSWEAESREKAIIANVGNNDNISNVGNNDNISNVGNVSNNQTQTLNLSLQKWIESIIGSNSFVPGIENPSQPTYSTLNLSQDSRVRIR